MRCCPRARSLSRESRHDAACVGEVDTLEMVRVVGLLFDMRPLGALLFRSSNPTLSNLLRCLGERIGVDLLFASPQLTCRYALEMPKSQIGPTEYRGGISGYAGCGLPLAFCLWYLRW